MTAILLGSGGSLPTQDGSNTTIPIPETLPNDPTVLIDVAGTGASSGSMPTGGLKDDVLIKLSGSDYDIGWMPITIIIQEWVEELVRFGVPEDTIIYRTGGLISSIVTASKTVTITRDGDGVITNVNDGKYSKDIIRTGGVITEIDVTAL